MFPTDATAYYNAHFGRGSGAIVLDDVRCTGTEDNLVDCPFDRSTVDCTHSDDAGVRCQITRELVFVRCRSKVGTITRTLNLIMIFKNIPLYTPAE